MTRLAFLTIGQSPRGDLSGVVERELPPGVTVSHLGALDGLGASGLAECASRPDEPWLISKLADGTVITLDADVIGARLQICIDRLEEQGTDIIVLLCTGEFPGLSTSRATIIEPDAVVCKTAQGLLGDRLAGIILPLPEQVGEARGKWAILGRPPIFSFASPYESLTDPLIAAATELQAGGAQALILDCMGYALWHKQALRAAGITLPVLVSGQVLAAALAAFM
ncbi:AroM family protein [Paracoccus sp. (in: a-proteobacteria)]|uniref:AroM family protein n=1 Tax=Paracoccus sp. TaxID=267 RepID=UPI003A89B61C